MAENELRGRPDYNALRAILATAEGRKYRGAACAITACRCGDFEAKIIGGYIALSPAYLAVLLDFVPMLAESLNDQHTHEVIR